MVNWQQSKQTVVAAIVMVLSCFCYCAFGSLSLRNYDNDPNMAKAMEYDLGENSGDYEKADRAKAEKYYLEYLKNVQESFQKARVYDHIGALYATGSNLRKGEKSDYDKARFYFRKVLELEPTRIARTTIRARVMLASIDKFGSDRVRADMDVYEWLRSIDEEKMRKLWLPLTPDAEAPTGTCTSNYINVESGNEEGITEDNYGIIVFGFRFLNGCISTGGNTFSNSVCSAQHENNHFEQFEAQLELQRVEFLTKPSMNDMPIVCGNSSTETCQNAVTARYTDIVTDILIAYATAYANAQDEVKAEAAARACFEGIADIVEAYWE